MAATPYSYRQYTGNGSTTSFAVPFPYLLKSHVRAYLGFNLLDGTFTLELAETTGYTWTSGTQIQTVAAPAAGQVLTVIRQTPNSQQLVEWQDGSTLISEDLNTSDKQNLYVIQEQQDRNDAGITQSTSATTTANAAASSASAAVTAANTANANASAAVATVNTANANASAALTAAGTANANASAAIAAANAANTAAGTASTDASTAVVIANTATSTANTADTKSDAAIAAVSSSLAYTPILNVAGIPASPANNTYIEVANSTGLQSFSPLTGIPAGFVGDSGLTVRLRYTTSPATWTWLNYFANNSDTRYLKLAGGTLTGPITLSGAPSSSLEAATKAYVDAAAQTTANAALPRAGGTMTGPITLSADPAAALQPATKQYTDAATSTVATAVTAAQTTANAALPKAGGTLTGNLNVPSINGGPIAGSRNRIINGDMRVDQRTAGAGTFVNNSSIAYGADRFQSRIEQATAQMTITTSSAAPTGFSQSLRHVVANSTAPAAGNRVHLRQNIEGFNVADFLWGSASAQTATLSFWVRSSITGTYGVGFSNSDENRSYVGTYVISAVNAWEYKTIAVPGDTSGTWLNGNNIGIRVTFDLGSGSSFEAAANTWTAVEACRASGCVSFQQQLSASSFYITGVQFESGTVATPFERRSIGQEIALCQRYFEASGFVLLTSLYQQGYWATEKRVSPTLTMSGFAGSGGAVAVNPDYPCKSWYQSASNTTSDSGKLHGNAEF